MGLLRRIANHFDPGPAPESRAVITSPYLAEVLGYRDTAAGEMVSPERATGVAAVHACVQLIAETVASLPLMPYRRLSDGGQEPDQAHPLHHVLHEQANVVQTAMEFREQLTASVLLTGNGYALKVLDGQGAVAELLPLHPASVWPERLVNGRVRYRVTHEAGGTDVFTQDEVLHIRYRSRDGFTGLSPITIARETVGTALAQQIFQASMLRNGARLSGVLKHPAKLSQEARQNLQESFQGTAGGPSNAGRVYVLEEGMTWEPMSMSFKDAEWVESRKLTLADIARIFRVPPPAIGILDNATYSNITEQQRALVMYTLRPWLVRIEQAMNLALLTSAGRRTHFIEHNAEGLLRGDQTQRYEAYRVGREWGWLSVNEIRRRENLGSVGPDGDTYREPLNTQPLAADANTGAASA